MPRKMGEKPHRIQVSFSTSVGRRIYTLVERNFVTCTLCIRHVRLSIIKRLPSRKLLIVQQKNPQLGWDPNVLWRPLSGILTTNGSIKNNEKLSRLKI